MYDKQKIDALVSALRDAAPTDCVSEVTGEFAGYFNELGITISLNDETSDEEIREVKSKILPVLDEFTIPSPWTVMFYRRCRLAATLFPSGLFTGADSPRVAIVLEPDNEDLEILAATMPVWAMESPSNRSAATLFWSKYPGVNSRDFGLTLFRMGNPEARYEEFAALIDTVQEHHWQLHRLYVFGLPLTEEIKTDLQILGFGFFAREEDGFIATMQT